MRLVTRHRRCVVLRGERHVTLAEARTCVSALAPEDVLFVGEEKVEGAAHVTPGATKKLLGRAFDAVVLDLHDGVDADVLGQCHGFVWGGGALVLRMPPAGVVPEASNARFAVWPHTPNEVTPRFWDRFLRCLARSDARAAPEALRRAPHEVHGTEEQREVVAALARGLSHPEPGLFALLSDRGRGKSSALGMALRAALDARPLRVAVTAGQAASAAEVFRFALGAPSPPREGPVRYVPPAELLSRDEPFDVIVVDEAAQLPVPYLEELVRRHPDSRIAFASTARGYEGTGRGFVLRFLAWLEHEPRPLARFTLTHPIRWDDDDPLERFVFDALLLDAEPARVPANEGESPPGARASDRERSTERRAEPPAPPAAASSDERRRETPPHLAARAAPDAASRASVPAASRAGVRGSQGGERLAASIQPVDLGAVRHVLFDRDALANDEVRLRELFGLLVHAHYRTTPSDLHRLLDAPNLDVHASLADGHVVAATLVAREGGLPPTLCEAMARGEQRIRGHALADTLIAHAGRQEAGELSMIRSVRIATHPALRRRGLAMGLVDHVHASYAPDLFGTLFGATPELLRFRRAAGYELVRVGSSRGSRTGEPAAVMLRPVSERARTLVRELRSELARELRLQLALFDAEGELSLAPALREALFRGLPPPAPLEDEELRRVLSSYVNGPRPYESAAFAITRFVEAHRDRLAALSVAARTLIDARVLRRRPWTDAAREAGYPSVPAAMRALRPALRELVARVEGARS